MSVLAGFATFVAIVRTGLLYVAVVLAAVCAIDWAVRTRRINPFSRVARFFRARVDPMMLPMERVIVRSGGLPANAPWWTLAAVIVGGILLISVLQLIGGLLQQALFGIADPSRIPKLLLSWAFSLLRVALYVRVLSSWLPVSPYSKWIRWSYVLTDWFIGPLQRIVPRVGMFDITPIVALFLLYLVQSALEIA
jgi:YggT family protein